MDSATTQYNPSHAKWLLSRLENCRAIDAYQPEDEDFRLCRNDGIRLSENPTRHDHDQIKALRAAAEPTWP